MFRLLNQSPLGSACNHLYQLTLSPLVQVGYHEAGVHQSDLVMQRSKVLIKL